MTEQEIWIKIVQNLAETSKKFLLKTLDGETLKKPYEEVVKTLDQNYLEYSQYLDKLSYTLQLIFGLNVHVGIGNFIIDLDKDEPHETDDTEKII